MKTLTAGCRLSCIASITVIICSSSYAQTLQLDASQASQQIEQTPQPCIQLTQLEIHEIATQQASTNFDWLTRTLWSDIRQELKERCFRSDDVSWSIQKGQNLLLEQGFITTRLLAGPQDIRQGRLILTLVPGRIHAIRTYDGRNDVFELINAFPMQAGDLLNLRDIEQALENIKRNPSVDANIQIQPASANDEQPGESDLVVTISESFPLRLVQSLDDSGTKETGKFQASTTLSLDNVFSLNDLFYLSHTTDLGGGGLPGIRGAQSDAYHYSLPYGYWLLSASMTGGRYYQSVAGINQNYIYSGTSATNELKISRVLSRNQNEKLSASIFAFQRITNNFIDGTEVAVQKRVEGGWGGNLQYKQFVQAATVDVGLTYKRGTGAFGAIAAPEQAYGEGSSLFSLATVDANLSVPFKLGTQEFRSTQTFRVQTNYSPLTPLNRFNLGGRYTIRGFDGESILSAERGWLLRSEASFIFSHGANELYWAIDQGEVAGASSDALVGKRLTGMALGLRGRISTINFDVFISAPIQKPDGFVTASSTSGFSLIAGF